MNMISIMRGHKVIWYSILALIGYTIFHYSTPQQHEVAKLTVEVLLFGVAVAVSYGWGISALDAIKSGASEDWDKGVLSIWGFWAAMVIQRLYAIIFIGNGRPQWMIELPISGLITVLFITAGVYALIAPTSNKVIPEEWMSKERYHLLTSVIIGIVAMVLVVLWLMSRGWSIV